jgi:replication factor C subunit 1
MFVWNWCALWWAESNDLPTVSTMEPSHSLHIQNIYLRRWLGQNSKQNKLSRQLGEVQIRMRLKVSGDKSEIRQTYIPALFPYIVKPLSDTGAVSVGFYLFGYTFLTHQTRQSAVDEVIDRMDEYYLSKEDWDTIVELGVGDRKDDVVLKKITPATKTSLTRK